MFVQTEETPNPNTLKFVPGKKVSECGPVEFVNKKETNNELVRNLLAINGVVMVFLGADFITIKKKDETNWSDIKHITISLINDYFLSGKESVLNKDALSADDKATSTLIADSITPGPVSVCNPSNSKFISFAKDR